MYSGGRGGGDFSSNEDSSVWTKEAKRVEQITKKEDDINRYKEAGRWDLVLNALEDYLRFQIEAIEEKSGDKKKTRGIETQTYQEQSKEILDLQIKWDILQSRPVDPAARMNVMQDKYELILRIKKMIDKVYHNNIIFNLTYRKKFDPTEAWKF